MKQNFVIPMVDCEHWPARFGAHTIYDLSKAKHQRIQNVFMEPLTNLSVGPFINYNLLGQSYSTFFPIDDCFVQHIHTLDDEYIKFWDPKNPPDTKSIIIWDHNMQAHYTTKINWFGEKPEPIIFSPVAKLHFMVPTTPSQQTFAELQHLSKIIAEEGDYSIKQRIFMDQFGTSYLLYKIGTNAFAYIRWGEVVKIISDPKARKVRSESYTGDKQLKAIKEMRNRYFQQLYGKPHGK